MLKRLVLLRSEESGVNFDTLIFLDCDCTASGNLFLLVKVGAHFACFKPTNYF